MHFISNQRRYHLLTKDSLVGLQLPMNCAEQRLSHMNVHQNHPESALKHTLLDPPSEVWFSSSGVGLGIWPSNSLPGDASACTWLIPLYYFSMPHTTYHKLSVFRKTQVYYLSFSELGVWAWVSWALCSGPPRCQSWGPLPKYRDCWQNSFPHS